MHQRRVWPPCVVISESCGEEENRKKLANQFYNLIIGLYHINRLDGVCVRVIAFDLPHHRLVKLVCNVNIAVHRKSMNKQKKKK